MDILPGQQSAHGWQICIHCLLLDVDGGVACCCLHHLSSCLQIRALMCWKCGVEGYFLHQRGAVNALGPIVEQGLVELTYFELVGHLLVD